MSVGRKRKGAMEDVEVLPGRTLSGRKIRKTNSLNVMFGSKYRHPGNRQTLMGQEQPLGKAYAIMAVMMYGPDLPTELSLHNERQRIFMAAAPYAMSSSDIDTVSEHPDDDERRIYYHNLLTTSCRPVSALLHNEVRDFFQTSVFTSPRHNPEYKLHLGLKVEESVFETYV